MKIAMIADLHFGIKKGNEIFLESQERFFKEQLVPELESQGIKDLWILGDVFDTRSTLSVMVINRVIDLFKKTLSGFDIKIIVGNHDMYLTTDTGINSLKILDLLPNVTVYETPEILHLDGKKILMLPWITDYTDLSGIPKGRFDYCFCHADIIGFDMGGGRLSEAGLSAKELLKRFDAVYAGHYHNGIHRQFEPGKSITYLGAPYQLTRIDRDGIRGYHILDIGTGERTLTENRMSMKFTKHTYPDADRSVVAGNVVDLDIPYEYSDQFKKIAKYVEELEKLGPAYPVNINFLPSSESDEEMEIDTSTLNIITLFQKYLDQLETKVDKKKLYESFLELYNTYKEQA